LAGNLRQNQQNEKAYNNGASDSVGTNINGAQSADSNKSGGESFFGNNTYGNNGTQTSQNSQPDRNEQPKHNVMEAVLTRHERISNRLRSERHK
jgi:hypothetical protein